jgi:hypothetical protein
VITATSAKCRITSWKVLGSGAMNLFQPKNGS